MFIVAIFVFMLIAGFFMTKEGKFPGFIKYAIFFVMIIGIIYVFSSFLVPYMPGIEDFFQRINLDSSDFAWIVAIVLIIVVVGIILGSGDNGDGPGKKFADAFKGLWENQ